ncbi:MAG: pyridoxamine 5'-phosphate oxidase family protein [Armatimonadota bacterium]
MRRHDREIQSSELIEDILRRGMVLHLAMVDGDRPYVLPLSYGYDGDALYLHCAPEGRKIDVLRACPRVCFAISLDHELITDEVPCGWGLRYRSVVGEGTVSFVEDEAGKRRGLDALMAQHGGAGGEYSAGSLERTTVLRVEITSLSGKQAGYE